MAVTKCIVAREWAWTNDSRRREVITLAAVVEGAVAAEGVAKVIGGRNTTMRPWTIAVPRMRLDGQVGIPHSHMAMVAAAAAAATAAMLPAPAVDARTKAISTLACWLATCLT